jgi:integral membrane sensor domain MASE1
MGETVFSSGKSAQPWLARAKQALWQALSLWLLTWLSVCLPYSVDFGRLAPPLWLPAGFCLAQAMLRGWSCWPGLLLGLSLGQAWLLPQHAVLALGMAAGQTLLPCWRAISCARSGWSRHFTA